MTPSDRYYHLAENNVDPYIIKGATYRQKEQVCYSVSYFLRSSFFSFAF